MAAGNKKGGDVVLGGRHLVGFFALLVVMLGVAFTLGYLLGRNQYDTQLRAAASTVPGSSDVPVNSAKSAASPGPVNAADRASPSKKNSAAHPPAPPRPDWDFYHSGEPAKPADRLAPQPNPPAQPNAAPPNTVPLTNRPASPSPVKSSAHSLSVSSSARGKSLARNSRQGSSSSPDAKSGSNGGTKSKDTSPGSAPPPAGSKFIPHGSIVLQVAAVVRQADALSLAQALQKKKFPAFVVPPETDRYYRVQVGPYPSVQAANATQQQLEKQGFKSIVKR
ncbi:MAG TPA: SPOR domain-containing protein [Candidatus Acidoferrales bacterium]